MVHKHSCKVSEIYEQGHYKNQYPSAAASYFKSPYPPSFCCDNCYIVEHKDWKDDDYVHSSPMQSQSVGNRLHFHTSSENMIDEQSHKKRYDNS
jgi:hypothetical protein